MRLTILSFAVAAAVTFCGPVHAITYNDFVTQADLTSVMSNTATIGFTYAGNKFVG
jgi:pyruvate/2-oxoglutarate/acetoin dehydrogenase E1 component